MLTVLTWFWRQPGGRTVYEPVHIAIWADMVRRHLSLPHRIAVVTDERVDLPSHVETIAPPREFEAVRIPTWDETRPQCLRRLAMFAPDAAERFGPRFVSMDLDCVIGGAIDPLFAGDEDFRICAGSTPGRVYNGSMMMLRAGARPQVYAQFTPEKAAEAGRRHLGSDQAWISHVLGPGEATWGPQDGVAFWGGRTKGAPRLLFFPGAVKPWDALHDRYVAQGYRREGGRRGLILGPATSVWDDADRALDAGDYDGVIAFPEPARHWPGPIEAVARDETHAARLARMLGFGEVAWCGR